MAEHGALDVGTATGVDYEEHHRFYLGFLRLTKWGIAAVVLLLIFLAWWAF